MNSRLFWKIAITIWITMALTTASVVMLRIDAYVKSGEFVSEGEFRAERERAAAVALRYGGPTALDQVTAAWPLDARERLRITLDTKGEANAVLEPLPGFTYFQHLAPVVTFLVGCLFFSALLAWYLSRPIALLRNGLRDLAQGKLGTRVASGIGSRRDEMADLTHDFDVMAERLHNLIASRDRLLHDVSHELRSPLGRLHLAVALARQNGELSDQTASRIEAESARLDAIVGDLLSLSRAEINVATENIYFDIAELLQTICVDARFEAQPLQVNIALELSPELTDPARAPLMLGAPELLRRAIENVIRNALRFSPQGKTVYICAGFNGDAVVIDIRDEGPGVSDELLESMFDPFVKGSDGNGEIGLGLSITRRALVAHKGKIEVLNHEGCGLWMRLTVPVCLGVQLLRSPEVAA